MNGKWLAEAIRKFAQEHNCAECDPKCPLTVESFGTRACDVLTDIGDDLEAIRQYQVNNEVKPVKG